MPANCRNQNANVDQVLTVKKNKNGFVFQMQKNTIHSVFHRIYKMQIFTVCSQKNVLMSRDGHFSFLFIIIFYMLP